MKRLGAWLVMLLMVPGLLAGCAGKAELRSQAAAAQSKAQQLAAGAAIAALDDVAAKATAGNGAAARKSYEIFATTFGQVLGPISLNDARLASRLAAANATLKEQMVKSQPDKAVVREQTQTLTTGLRQASAALATPIAATAGVQLGMAQGEQTITVKATEYKFEPALIEVPKGTTVHIVLQNVGKEKHEFDLDAFNFEIKPVAPGQTGEGTFVADEPGTFMYACNIDGHKEKGMMGFLVVK